jgi:hypothetical protein
VKDVHKTVGFYKTLGFVFKKNKPTHATGYINRFWIDFLQSDKEDKPGLKDDANARNKCAGRFSTSASTMSMRPTRA